METTHPFDNPFQEQLVKTCPKCTSIFVTEKECEACGLQFWIDLLGEPAGNKSAYGLRERFTKLGRIRNKMGYVRQLEKRMKDIIHWAFEDEIRVDRKLAPFYLEFEDILAEIWLYNGKDGFSFVEEWQSLLEKHKLHPHYKRFMALLLPYRLKNKKDFLSKGWGIFSIEKTLTAVSLLLGIIFTSLVIYRYFAITLPY